MRKGCEVPRIWTKPLRPLTPATSRGFECIEFAEDVLGVELFPWQKWLLIHALELNVDGTYRFRTVLVLVARQNGKTLLMTILTLWRMYMDDGRLIIGTAQNLDIAEEAWQAAVEMAEEEPELAEQIKHVDKGSGKKALRLETGERYKVAAASRRGGRGLSGDLVLLDELREHQSWDSWGAVTKTTLARAFAQIWGFSNAGDAASIVLRHVRRMAITAPGVEGGADEFSDETVGKVPDPDRVDPNAEPDEMDKELAQLLEDNSLGIFEWSAPRGAELHDLNAWAQANPSLGYAITERAIVGALRTDPEWVFRTEVMCQWSSTTAASPFGAQAWEKSADAESAPAEGEELALGIDFEWDQSRAAISLAGLRPDGRIHGETVAIDHGTDWVIPWLRVRLDDEVHRFPDGEVIPKLKLKGITIQTSGAPISFLGDQIQALCDEFGIEFVGCAGADLGKACSQIYNLVRKAVGEDGTEPDPAFLHLPQPVLDRAAATARTRPAQDAWLFDRKNSPDGIAALMALTFAVWLLLKPVEVKPVSAYATYSFETF